MQNPTDILKKEHDVVLSLLDKLGENITSNDLKSSERTINILEKEFNKHSLNKEEKVLFPEIEKFIPREGGPTGVMVLEHEDLTSSIKDFKENLKKNNSSKTELIGQHIISLLTEHINKENNMLFMIADMHLDENQNKTISDKFKKIDLKYK